MAEIVLDQPRVVAAIGQVVAARVPEHVRVDVEGQPGALADGN
jgi:hypothetical protein